MNGMDSKHLIDYFRNKKGKYLKLDNGGIRNENKN